MLEGYVGAGIAIVVGLGLTVVFTLLAKGLGPKHTTAIKETPFECGSDPVGSPRLRFSVKFYVVAILFLVFDIETALLYPWAVNYRSMIAAWPGSAFPLVEMLVFLSVLVVAWLYVWRKKAVGWE